MAKSHFANIGYEVKRDVKDNFKVWGLFFFFIFLSIIQKEHNLKIKTSPSPKDPGSLTLAPIHSLTHLHTYPSTLHLSIYPSTHLSITIDIDRLVNYFSSLMRNFLKTNVNKTTCNKQ